MNPGVEQVGVALELELLDEAAGARVAPACERLGGNPVHPSLTDVYPLSGLESLQKTRSAWQSRGELVAVSFSYNPVPRRIGSRYDRPRLGLCSTALPFSNRIT